MVQGKGAGTREPAKHSAGLFTGKLHSHQKRTQRVRTGLQKMLPTEGIVQEIGNKMLAHGKSAEEML